MATTKKTTTKKARKTVKKVPTVKKVTAARKTVASAKSRASKKAAPKKVVSPEERYRMIEVSAYFLAEKNGFKGNSTEYWLQAEEHVNRLLKKK